MFGSIRLSPVSFQLFLHSFHAEVLRIPSSSGATSLDLLRKRLIISRTERLG